MNKREKVIVGLSVCFKPILVICYAYFGAIAHFTDNDVLLNILTTLFFICDALPNIAVGIISGFKPKNRFHWPFLIGAFSIGTWAALVLIQEVEWIYELVFLSTLIAGILAFGVTVLVKYNISRKKVIE